MERQDKYKFDIVFKLQILYWKCQNYKWKYLSSLARILQSISFSRRQVTLLKI